MHVLEQSKSLPPIQPPPHCPKNCSSAASLHRHRDSLQEEFLAAGLSGGFAETPSEVFHEVHCCFSQHSRSLHHERYVMVWLVSRCAYLATFNCSACAATTPAPLTAAETCEGLWVSGTWHPTPGLFGISMVGWSSHQDAFCQIQARGL